MAVTALSVVLVLGLALASSATRIDVRDFGSVDCPVAGADAKPKPPAAVSCGDNKDKTACLCDGAQEGDCAWCKGDFMPASCVGTKAAEWIPGTVATCKMPKKEDAGTDGAADLTLEKKHKGGDDPAPEPAVSCGDNKEKHACLHEGAAEGDCAWCEGDWMPASCVSTKAAEWIPGTVASCKLPKKEDASTDGAADLTLEKKHKGGDDPAPEPAVSCGDNKEKHACLHEGAAEGDCAWCEGDWMPASCVSTKAAEWIPGTVASCKLPKKKDASTDGAADLTLEKKHKGGDDPAPEPAVSCGDNKEKHACLHEGAAEGDCAWCEGDWMPASCVSTKAAEWIPGTVASCKLPKKHGGDAVVESANGADSGSSGWGPSGGSSGGGFIPGGGSSGGGFIPGGGSIPGGGGDYPGGGGQGQGGGCMDLKSRHKCLKSTDTEMCSWCQASFMGAERCVATSSTAYLPDIVAKCEQGRDPSDRTHHGKHHGKHGGKTALDGSEEPEQPEQDEDGVAASV